MSKPEIKYIPVVTMQNEYTVDKLKQLCELFGQNEEQVIERAIKKLYYELWKEIKK